MSWFYWQSTIIWRWFFYLKLLFLCLTQYLLILSSFLGEWLYRVDHWTKSKIIKGTRMFTTYYTVGLTEFRYKRNYMATAEVVNPHPSPHKPPPKRNIRPRPIDIETAIPVLHFKVQSHHTRKTLFEFMLQFYLFSLEKTGPRKFSRAPRPHKANQYLQVI